MDTSRYMAAIERNLAELQRALLNRQILVAMEGAGGISNISLKVIYYALFNDYIAHCIKVFERSGRAASFWYIYGTNQKPVNDYARENGIDITSFERLSKKLKHVRDKTHFHIDRENILDSKSVWKEAGLNGKELGIAVDQAWSVLNVVRVAHGQPPMEIPLQDEDVIKRVTILMEESRIPAE